MTLIIDIYFKSSIAQIIIELIINLGNKYNVMRKTTQSMYQSNLKVPVTTSKVFDGSNLFKSSGNINQEGRPSTANKSAYHQPIRKVEGQDLGRSQKFPKKNFEQTVNNLKNKPTQKVLEE